MTFRRPRSPAENESANPISELNILRDVFRLLPAGVTVQDERGEIPAGERCRLAFAADGTAAAAAPSQAGDRRETCLELPPLPGRRRRFLRRRPLPAARPNRYFLTSHRPVRIADRDFPACRVSADITEQKAFEDQLFRSAYYDELTGLPDPPRVSNIASTVSCSATAVRVHFRAWRFSTSTIFKHINDYYGHSIGDALLVEMAKRLGLDLREFRTSLSRISGDEFVLLLNPIQGRERSRGVHRLHPASG